MMKAKFWQVLVVAALMAGPAHAQAVGASVYLEELTWQEISQKLQTGNTTAIIPTGGTQQMGPHMVVGAHNSVARYAAGEVARKMGGALVAPVVPFAPAGRVTPPEGSMQFAGTISLSEAHYADVLEDVARSLKQHGFRMICFLGDDVGSQKVMARVAAKLGREWVTDGVRVLHVNEYFARHKQDEWNDNSPTPAKVSGAAAPTGHIETSELMAVDAQGVRATLLGVRAERDYRATGAVGDTTMATAALGNKYLSLKIESAIKQIQHAASQSKK